MSPGAHIWCYWSHSVQSGHQGKTSDQHRLHTQLLSTYVRVCLRWKSLRETFMMHTSLFPWKYGTPLSLSLSPYRPTFPHSVSPPQRSTAPKVTFSGSTRPSRRRAQSESSPHSNLQSHWTPLCQNFSDFCHESPPTKYSENSTILLSF